MFVYLKLGMNFVLSRFGDFSSGNILKLFWTYLGGRGDMVIHFVKCFHLCYWWKIYILLYTSDNGTSPSIKVTNKWTIYWNRNGGISFRSFPLQPATVSRCGMIYLEPSNLGWRPVLKSWINDLPEMLKAESALINALFEWLLEPCLVYLRKNLKVTSNQKSLCWYLCNIFFTNFFFFNL